MNKLPAKLKIMLRVIAVYQEQVDGVIVYHSIYHSNLRFQPILRPLEPLIYSKYTDQLRNKSLLLAFFIS
jgi:hypothetical protein